MAIAAWRLLLAAAVLVPLAMRGGGIAHIAKRDLAWSVLSGAALAVHFVLWITSLQQTSVASSVLFMSTHPVFVGLGSWIFLRERVRPAAIAGIVFSVIGGSVIAWGDLRFGEMTLRGDLLALGGGCALAIYFLIGRRVRRNVPVLLYIAVAYAAAAFLVLGACLATRTPIIGYAPATYGYLILLAVGPQLIGHSTFNWALKHLAASSVSILVLSEAVGSALLAVAFFGESLTWLNGLGGFLILLGITLSTRNREASHGQANRPGEDHVGGGPHAAS